MIKNEMNTVVDASVEQVFAYLSDPARVPEYETGTDEVKDIQRLPDGRYTYTEISKVLGLHLASKCEQTEVIPNERIVQTWQGGGMDSTVTFRFEPVEGGKTRVSVDGETTLHAGPLAKFGEPFFQRYFDHGVEMAAEAAKAHIEAEVRVATPS